MKGLCPKFDLLYQCLPTSKSMNRIQPFRISKFPDDPLTSFQCHNFYIRMSYVFGGNPLQEDSNCSATQNFGADSQLSRNPSRVGGGGPQAASGEGWWWGRRPVGAVTDAPPPKQ